MSEVGEPKAGLGNCWDTMLLMSDTEDCGVGEGGVPGTGFTGLKASVIKRFFSRELI